MSLYRPHSWEDENKCPYHEQEEKWNYSNFDEEEPEKEFPSILDQSFIQDDIPEK
jgi:hypothetical protein